MSAIADQAQYFRLCLLLGLTTGESAVAWAEHLLQGETSAVSELVEVATADPEDVTELRYRLFELSGEEVSLTVQHSILSRICRVFSPSDVSCSDTVMVLSQFRRFEKIAPNLADRIIYFEEQFSRVSEHDSADALADQVREWLNLFSESSDGIASQVK